MITKPHRHIKHITTTTPKGTIHIKKTNKGKLHSKLGVPQSQKIPMAKIKAAEKSPSEPLRAEAQFADNASKWQK